MEMLFEPGEFHIYTTQKIEDIKQDLVPWGGNFIITDLKEAPNQNMVLYPNPSNDFVHITGIPSGNYQITLTDISGRQLMDQWVSVNRTYVKDIADIPNGMYYLTIQGNQRNVSFKIIKN
jgi:hypothetical protein